MSSRLPALARDETSTAEQRAAFDALEQEASETFGTPDQSPFVFKDASGALIGPFPFFLESPDAGTHVLRLFRKLAAIPGLPPEAKETAILTVGAHFNSDYELYAHKRVAVEKAGIPQKVVDAIARGEKPDGLSEGAALALDVTRQLLVKPGKLSDDMWLRSVNAFGRQGTVALVHYVGAYAYTCIVLNAIDAPTPT